MILVDANVLLYAYHADAPQHPACRRWLEAALNGQAPVGFPSQTLLAFIRLASDPRVFSAPLSAAAALALVERWLARPQAVRVEPGPRFFALLAEVMEDGRVSGALITDAALAALALENGAAICTTDRDFRRLSGLRLVDPLAGGSRT